MYIVKKRIKVMAVAVCTATAIVACKDKIPNAGKLDMENTPTQIVHNISAVQTSNGELSYKLVAPIMERFENAEVPYEIFREGINVFGYTEDGLLETMIVADQAKHKTGDKSEKWEAYGNVKITNFIKGQRMLTDTLYWDRDEKKIYTHCFVRMSSPQGYVQGYGMTSDEMARNVTVLRPFDNYVYVAADSTSNRYVDTVNFVGPVIK